MFLRISIIISILIIVFFVFNYVFQFEELMKKENLNEKTDFIITYSGSPNSFDPLDFDSANNFNFARMLYSTPIEFDSKGNLTSSVLNNFSYDQINKTLLLDLKPNLTYEDGEPITIDDIELAIKRMIWSRPKFPVLEKINGVEEWLLQENPLLISPKGFSKEGNILKISFNEPVEHPLFRFTLELFSIQPSKCFDLKTGKLKCQKPSESGPYKILDERELVSPYFKLRSSWHNQNLKSQIQFKYIPLSKVNFDELAEDSVVAISGEESFTVYPKDELKKMHFLKTPDAWHLTLKLNSEGELFGDQFRRKIFISYIRKQLNTVCPLNADCNSSFFSKLSAGYVEFTNDDNKENLKEIFKKNKNKEFIWISRGLELSIIDNLIEKFCLETGIKFKRIVRGTKEASEAISHNSFDLFIGMTGFWSMDPYGDAQMLFTPNLHFALKDLWHDQELQTLLRKLNKNNSDTIQSDAIRLNKHIYENSIYNVVAHFSFMYFSKVEISNSKIPQSGTIPYPWFFY